MNYVLEYRTPTFEKVFIIFDKSLKKMLKNWTIPLGKR